MGVIYYGVCHDCKQFIDLDKFRIDGQDWKPDHALELDYDLTPYLHERFLYRTLRLNFFIGQHQGHRLGVYDEYDFCKSEKREDGYEETFPFPKS